MSTKHIPYRVNDSSMLYLWLRKVTWGLCPEAVDRVSQEIKEHYIAAVEERMAEGMDFESAEASALKTLGSARAARRRLKKTYLTTMEYNLLQSIQGSLWQVTMIPVVAAIFGVCSYFASRMNGDVDALTFVWLGAYTLSLSIPLSVGPALRRIFTQAPLAQIVKMLVTLQLLVLACYTGNALVFLVDGYQAYRSGSLDTLDSASKTVYLRISMFTLLPIAYAWLFVSPVIKVSIKLRKPQPPVQS